MIHIEVWSDIVCPFCYIGKRRLEAALAEFEHRDKVRVEWKSFELDPHAERTPLLPLNELLSKKYGESVAWAQQMHDQMTEQAREVGLTYRFDLTQPTNSFDAHRLIHLAEKHGMQDAMKERLCEAYYTRGEHIGDLDTLERIGTELGLPHEEVRRMLHSDAFSDDVRVEEERAAEIGVRGVPFFLFNGKYVLSGAQPLEVFRRALQTAWDDRGAWPVIRSDAECGPTGCQIQQSDSV